jgi:hypothetical protein
MAAVPFCHPYYLQNLLCQGYKSATLKNKTGTKNQGRIAATNDETPAAVLPQMTKPSRK